MAGLTSGGSADFPHVLQRASISDKIGTPSKWHHRQFLRDSVQWAPLKVLAGGGGDWWPGTPVIQFSFHRLFMILVLPASCKWVEEYMLQDLEDESARASCFFQ